MIGGDHSATPAVVSITSAKGRKNLLADTSARYVDPSAIDLTKARRCPFCADAKDGGAVVEYHDDACDPPLMYRYTCMGCACEGPSKESAAEAIEAWNSRAALTLDDLPRLRDEDREALETGYVALEGVPSSDDDTPSLALRVELDDLMDYQQGPLAEAQALADVLELVALDKLTTHDCTQEILTRMLRERLAEVRKSVDRALTLHLQMQGATASEVAQ